MKSQDTAYALEQLAVAAPPSIRLACIQNGVENERVSVRHFRNVYSALVMVPATFLGGQCVYAHGHPLLGALDVGRYPSGSDDVCFEMSNDFRAANFSSIVRSRIMDWKYRKLIVNLRNGLELVCGQVSWSGPVLRKAEREAERVIAAAGIELVTSETFRERVEKVVHTHKVGEVSWPGSSALQSNLRGVGGHEVYYLNGEVSLLGRLYGIATPINDRICRFAQDVVNGGIEVGSVPEAVVLGRET